MLQRVWGSVAADHPLVCGELSVNPHGITSAANAAKTGACSMTCNYCRAQNHSDDHRCTRCGRRLSDEPANRPAMFPVQQSAAAPKFDTVEAPAPVPLPARPGPQLV